MTIKMTDVEFEELAQKTWEFNKEQILQQISYNIGEKLTHDAARKVNSSLQSFLSKYLDPYIQERLPLLQKKLDSVFAVLLAKATESYIGYMIDDFSERVSQSLPNFYNRSTFRQTLKEEVIQSLKEKDKDDSK